MDFSAEFGGNSAGVSGQAREATVGLSRCVRQRYVISACAGSGRCGSQGANSPKHDSGRLVGQELLTKHRMSTGWKVGGGATRP